jgi:hypothetical protein
MDLYKLRTGLKVVGGKVCIRRRIRFPLWPLRLNSDPFGLSVLFLTPRDADIVTRPRYHQPSGTIQMHKI